ncbi:MAG TPA: efflux RND transporter periplasmic adaptor subunit [Vicinamibacteria bacterium]|nr:efflux RND transporter periplasmic adaptor subunit [Vicinamibacteria bacterium]
MVTIRPPRFALLAVGLLVVVAAAFFLTRKPKDLGYTTTSVERGEIAEVVGATGIVEAVTTVQVGSQVSGTILNLLADFNSVVKKGQVIARLDPSLFEARLGQARANLVSARANAERARAGVGDTQQKLVRAEELANQNLLPQSDLETARANQASAVAQVKAADAAVTQAEASVNQAEVDLDHSIIAAPIDGIVIARNVSVGQTVAASFQAPVLFVIANDLTRMRVNASIDEADIGRVQMDQEVSFRVDAYPERNFRGRVEQVRLQPTTVQNVVTYNTIIAVDNPEQKLMPGMTATVSVIVRRVENALRIPASALRFRPQGFEARSGPGGRPGAGGRDAAMAAPAGRPGGEGRPGGGRGMGRSAGEEPGSPAGTGVRPREGAGRPALVFVASPKGQPEPKRIRTGISDGQFVEVKEGLDEGASVITGYDLGLGRPMGSARSGASPSANPFSPTRPPDRRRE